MCAPGEKRRFPPIDAYVTIWELNGFRPMRRSPEDLKKTLFKLKGLFFAMALVLVASIAATFIVGLQVLVARDKVQARDAILAQLQAILSEIQNAETGQRGYLLTAETRYLEPYEQAMANMPTQFAGLRELSAGGLVSDAEIQEIQGLTDRKFQEMAGTIQLVRNGQRETALNTVRGDSGKRIMDTIREKISSLRNRQEQARAEAHREDRVATTYRTLMFVGAALVNLAFLFWAYHRIVREMSLQYVATLEIERQKEILAVTLASIGDAVIIADVQGSVTFLNAIAEQLTGWTAAEAGGQPCSKVFHIINEHSREPVDSPVDKVLASGMIVGLANHTLLIRKDGSELPIDDSGAPIREADGTVRGVVLVFRDFSAHKETERLLVNAKEEMEAASKAKDRFLATLSHELRTPLTPVLATLSAWQARHALPPILHPDLQLLRRNVELEARLIDDLLDITRIENGKLFLEKETVDAHGLIEAVATLFRADCGARNISVSLKLQARHSFVEADSARLQQVFWNIIGNAVKFTGTGGDIEIVTTNPNPQTLRVDISDTGIGMSRETLASLFQRFEQGRLAPQRRAQGLGLGLSIARALVDSHGGTLEASSLGLDRGASFTVTLPARPAPADSSRESSPSAGRPAGRKLWILLLEDHEDTAVVMESVLRSMGHEVVTRPTVAEALHEVRKKSFDIILSDLGLPDGSGLDFIRTAREVTQVPAVALTGYGMAEDIEKCLAAGFTEHLTKPVDFERLEMTLVKFAGVAKPR